MYLIDEASAERNFTGVSGLRDRPATVPNEVWSMNIPYTPMAKGFRYLAAVLDWYSRYVISEQLSNSLDVGLLPAGPGRCPARGPGPAHLQFRLERKDNETISYTHRE